MREEIEKYLKRYKAMTTKRQQKRDAVSNYVQVATTKELDKFIALIIKWNKKDL